MSPTVGQIEPVARAICASGLNCQRLAIGRGDAQDCYVEGRCPTVICRASRGELILGPHWESARAALGAVRLTFDLVVDWFFKRRRE